MSSIPILSKTITEEPGISGTAKTAGLGNENSGKDDVNLNEAYNADSKNICDTSLKTLNKFNYSGDHSVASKVYTADSDESNIGANKSIKNVETDSFTDQDKRYHIRSLQQGQESNNSNDKPLEPSNTASAGEQIKPTIPSPLNLPKRFIKPQSSNQIHSYASASNNSSKGSPSQRELHLKDSAIISPKISPTGNSSDKNSYYQPIPPQQVQQIQQMQATPYQQLFYNVQTGQIVSMPMASPVVPPIQQLHVSPQALPQPLIVLPQQRLQPQNQQQQQQQQQQQIVYVRGVNGQLIPVLTPSSSHPISKPQFRAGSPLNSNKRSDSVSPSGGNNKRHKSSLDTKLTSTQAAERLQKQQIQLQAQMHPNLSSEFETTNISDVFVENSDIVNPSYNANNADDTFEDDSNEKNDDAEAQFVDSADSVNSQQEKKPFTQKVIGTLTLGSFTYRYSQTLSGNIAKDKELFDRLADNAWKACIAKR